MNPTATKWRLESYKIGISLHKKTTEQEAITIHQTDLNFYPSGKLFSI